MQQSDKVLVVLNNFTRPHNMPKIISAWRNQTVQTHIVVVDNRPFKHTNESVGGQILYPDSTLLGADDVWRWTTNNGCPCKFYPALSYTNIKYTLFADDDIIPGHRAIEALLERAKQVEDKFATIGQIGRTFVLANERGNRYSTRNVVNNDCHAQWSTFYQVHLTIRAHLILTDNLIHALSFRNQIAALSEDGQKLAHVHDDFLLSIGIQKAIGYPSYVTNNELSKQLIKQDLDDGKGVWKRPDHFKERNRMVDISLELGWKG